MAITNGSFEDQSGDFTSWPSGWSAHLISFSWGYHGAMAPYSIPEAFEYDYVTWSIVYTALTGTISVGDTVTQVTSGATGTVARHDTGDKLLVIRPAWGTFNDSNNIEVDGSNYVTGPTSTSASNQDSLDEYELADLDNAIFDVTTPEAWEDFEEEWSDNEDSVTEWDDNDDPLEFDTAGDEHEDFEEEWPAAHKRNDDRSITYWPLAVTLSDADTRARLNTLKATYEAHRVDTDHHLAADTDNSIAAADCTDESSAITLATEMWSDVFLHSVNSSGTYHDIARQKVFLTLPSGLSPPADYGGVKLALMYIEFFLELHFSWADCSGAGYAGEFISLASWTATDGIRELVVDHEFDSGSPEEHEDFEEEWSDNEDSIAAFVPATHLDDLEFTMDGGTTPNEDFEEDLPLVFPTPGTGSELALSPSCGCQINCTGTFSGTAHVQTRDKGSATWVSRETITTVPVDIHLDPGRVAVRIYTPTYVSGTPAATLHHQELE